MPISRNTSSNGAPKRSAKRLDRMPAMTSTAPSRMVMLTESRELMGLRKSLQLHPYRRHSSAPTDFCRRPDDGLIPLYRRVVTMASRRRVCESAGYLNQPVRRCDNCLECDFN